MLALNNVQNLTYMLFLVGPWLFVSLTLVTIISVLAMGLVTKFALRATAGVLGALKVQSLLERMTEVAKDTLDLRKLCACSYEKNGKTHLAIQIATADNFWSHHFVGDNLADSIDGILLKTHSEKMFSAKSCGSVCANCKRCPKVDFAHPAIEHIMIEPLYPDLRWASRRQRSREDESDSKDKKLAA